MEILEWLFTQIPEITGGLLAGGIITLVLTRHFEKINERRKLVASAYKSALGWQEMLYRVRSRGSDKDSERKLIERFHDLQEELNYFQGMMSAESKTMGKSYKKFVKEVKEENAELIQAAWKSAAKKPEKGTPKDENHPNINKTAEGFLLDSRLWLKWWLLPKAIVWVRNR